ncbi:heparan sulfate glucosamine 3-O-sulfotransferase 1-like [Mercenaria mercenaria]|uniref:heparan sulfate glucosamine 3-O-sulfotransferase 1-like n=1 Tax=Mercenaria mercenaria TaxID=6596 RepID=UPI00234E5B80|nr:heparan sulfate glucosamine 3-O-sulfotransferase 1-like [Mercenaria mercenaria]
MNIFQNTKTLLVTLVFIVLINVLIFVPEYKVCIPQKFVPYKTDELQQRVNTKMKSQKQLYKKSGSPIEGNQELTVNENFKKSEIKLNESCEKRLPQAIVVGIQKCGTTALVKFLGAHPQIAAYAYEAQYFYGQNYETHSLDWYRNLMPCSYSNQITIEKSPPYFYRSVAAERIRKMNPKTKIIIIVKDPITRAVSMYAMLKEYNKVDGKTFEECVTLEDNKTINGSSRFIEFSNYPKHVNVWLEIFDREQILVLDGHNMETDPAEELKKVEHFLRIKHFLTPDKFAFNETKGKHCLNIGNELNCLNAKKGRRHPDIDTNLRKTLENHFRPLNEEFFKMINKRFDWGY